MTLPGVRDVARPTSPSPTIEEAPDSPRDRRSPTITASRSIIVRATRARMIALLSKCGGFADLASLDRQGIILIAASSVRQFSRRETIGPHTVETAISVYPAVGHGYRGGLATAGVIVTVDGRKKIDCPYDQGPIELAELDILPLEGTISITGSYDDKEVRGGIPLDSTKR